MVGNDNYDPDDSPQARVDKIFDLMDEVSPPARGFALPWFFPKSAIINI